MPAGWIRKVDPVAISVHLSEPSFNGLFSESSRETNKNLDSNTPTGSRAAAENENA